MESAEVLLWVLKNLNKTPQMSYHPLVQLLQGVRRPEQLGGLTSAVRRIPA